MDEAERRRFLETLRQDDTFRADVRRELLMQELLELPQTVALLAASVNGLIEHQAEMQRQLDTLRSDVDALVTTTRQIFEVVGNGFAEMRQGFAAIRAEMQSGFAAVDTRFEEVDARFDRYEAEFRHNGNPPTS